MISIWPASVALLPFKPGHVSALSSAAPCLIWHGMKTSSLAEASVCPSGWIVSRQEANCAAVLQHPESNSLSPPPTPFTPVGGRGACAQTSAAL